MAQQGDFASFVIFGMGEGTTQNRINTERFKQTRRGKRSGDALGFAGTRNLILLVLEGTNRCEPIFLLGQDEIIRRAEREVAIT
jgi:hypothetical protein